MHVHTCKYVHICGEKVVRLLFAIRMGENCIFSSAGPH